MGVLVSVDVPVAGVFRVSVDVFTVGVPIFDWAVLYITAGVLPSLGQSLALADWKCCVIRLSLWACLQGMHGLLHCESVLVSSFTFSMGRLHGYVQRGIIALPKTTTIGCYRSIVCRLLLVGLQIIQ